MNPPFTTGRFAIRRWTCVVICLVCACTPPEPDPEGIPKAGPSTRESPRPTSVPGPDAFEWTTHELEAVGVRASFIAGVEVREFEVDGTRHATQSHPTFSLAVSRGPGADLESWIFRELGAGSSFAPKAKLTELCDVTGQRQELPPGALGGGLMGGPGESAYMQGTVRDRAAVAVAVRIEGERLLASYVVDADHRDRLAYVEARFFDDLRCR